MDESMIAGPNKDGTRFLNEEGKVGVILNSNGTWSSRYGIDKDISQRMMFDPEIISILRSLPSKDDIDFYFIGNPDYIKVLNIFTSYVKEAYDFENYRDYCLYNLDSLDIQWIDAGDVFRIIRSGSDWDYEEIEFAREIENDWIIP